MKRNLAVAILGITASVTMVASVHAQGYVMFANYGASTYAPVTYTPGGAGLNNTYTAGLWYFLGTTTLGVGSGYDSMPVGWELASVTQQFNSGATAGPAGAGLFVGGAAEISDYVNGPITFAVTAYNSPFGTPTTPQGHSAGFTLASIATGTTGVGEFGPGFQSFALLPEPSIFALSGLGAGALFLLRRRGRA